jgi:hypothetical protein
MPGVIAGKVKERKRLHEQEFPITIQREKKEKGSFLSPNTFLEPNRRHYS